MTGALPDLLRHLLKPVAEAFHHGIEERLETLVANAIPGVLRGFGCELVGMLLSHVRGFMGTCIACTEAVDGKRCGEWLEFERNQPTTVKTILGEVRYSRAYYHGACGHSAFPLDALLGIDAQRMLPQVQEEISLLSSQMPYEHALDTITRWTGMAMSKATVENATQRLADEKRAEQEAEREAAFEKEFRLPEGETPPGPVAFVSMDGGYCKIVGQQEEAEFKVGVLGSFVPVGDRSPDASTGEVSSRALKPPPDILGKRYVGRFENAETFMERLAVEFHKAGLHKLDVVNVLQRGFIIGSGSAEGGIRFVGKDRLYRSGMKWHVLGAEEILVLRCVWASGCWQQFQEQRHKKRLEAYKQRKTIWTQAMARAA